MGSSPVKSARRDADAASRRRKQKTAVAAAAATYQPETNADDTLYCLCKTPYDESKLVSTNTNRVSVLVYQSSVLLYPSLIVGFQNLS